MCVCAGIPHLGQYIHNQLACAAFGMRYVCNARCWLCHMYALDVDVNIQYIKSSSMVCRDVQ